MCELVTQVELWTSSTACYMLSISVKVNSP